MSFILLLGGCIGTDVVDDPLVDGRLEITPESIAMMVGETKMVDARYFNTFGIEETVPITWSTSLESIATVNAGGQISAKSAGQAFLFAAYSVTKDSIRITVVQDDTEVASVQLVVPKTSLAIGESVTATAVAKNINNESIAGGVAQWFSSDDAVAAIDESGLVMAQANGTARIHAIVDGVFSNEVEITVGGGKRTGTFQSANGYDASGMATLELINDELILKFSDNFMTDFALGTFIYLANNNTSGTTIRNEGIELGEITMNGAHTFNVTQNFPGTTLSQFEYVIVLCKPASIPFGFAQLN